MTATEPTTDGSYRNKIVAVEPDGNAFIADADRHGKPSQLFWTWTSPNLEFATIANYDAIVTPLEPPTGKVTGLEPVTSSAYIKERLDAITVG